MKELLVISGKGGTGKTSLTASFAALANDVVLVDCDTDAANLHLMVNHQITAVYEFYGLPKVEIDLDKCQRCRRCLSGCTYQAIRDYRVDEILCEGCQVCLHLCPWQAISVKPHLAGHWYTADSAYGPFVYARLGVAEENSGKLVAEIRSKAKEIAKQMKKTLIIRIKSKIMCKIPQLD